MQKIVAGVAPEILACIREARDPTIQELGRLAERVRLEIFGSSPAFPWANADEQNAERTVSFRVAQVALTGDMVQTVSGSPEATAAPSERPSVLDCGVATLTNAIVNSIENP